MIDISFKPGALEKIMQSNARSRAGWERLELLASKYDIAGNRVLDIGIHGDVWPGGHKYMFKNATYETLDVDAGVLPTHVGDIRSLIIPDNTFDMIICHSVMEHVLDRRVEAYSELYRVLRVGGTLVYAFPSLIDEREVEPAKFVSITQFQDANEGRISRFEKLEDGNYFVEIEK